MDDIKIGEILLPGEDEDRNAREKKVRKNFWPTMKKAIRRIPFAREVVAAYYCALDPETPTRVRGILLAALAYFVMPIDVIPDILALVGFSDDIAVLAAAFSAVRAHMKPKHFDAADKALEDEGL